MGVVPPKRDMSEKGAASHELTRAVPHVECLLVSTQAGSRLQVAPLTPASAL